MEEEDGSGDRDVQDEGDEDGDKEDDGDFRLEAIPAAEELEITSDFNLKSIVGV